MDTTLATRHAAISSDRVSGTDVFNPAGDSLGTIDYLVIDKRSGDVRYAVLEFGGLFGMGADRYPLPWSLLKYDTDKGGYVVPLEKEQLSDAPRYVGHTRPEWDDVYARQLNTFYGTPWV